MQSLEITVVTASINRPTLGRACDSVQSQTLLPLRHCILLQQRLQRPWIDIAKPAHVPIAILWLPPPQPADMAQVYNLADEMAHTEWVAMLDDDCWWEPEHLETLAVLAEETGSDFVWSSSYLHDERTGKLLGKRDDPMPQLGHIDTNEILFRRDCIDRWGDFSMKDPGMERFRGRGIDGRRIERWVRGGARYAHSGRATCHFDWRPVPESYHGELDAQGRPMPIRAAVS